MVRRAFMSFVMVAVVSLAAATAIGADQAPASSPSPGGQTPAAEDEAAKKIFEAVCSTCHDTAIATTTFRTAAEWTEMIELMVSFGASASEGELMQIHRYLSRHNGRINLNRAPVAELQLVLDVSEDIAKAIADLRTTTPLTTAEDLRKVRGFPVERLESLAPRLQF